MIRYIKKLQSTIFFLFMSGIAIAQNNSLPELMPYFSAIIVSDIDTSVNWYVEKLGFEILDQVNLEERGLKQSNLKRHNALLELIQINNTVFSKEILSQKPKGTQVGGYFKFGFMVSNFDMWIIHLSDKGVDTLGKIVQDPITNKKMIVIKDPDGNRIQLFEL